MCLINGIQSPSAGVKMKKATKNTLLDKLHLYSVRSMIGMTVAGLGLIAVQVYSYFTGLYCAAKFFFTLLFHTSM